MQMQHLHGKTGRLSMIGLERTRAARCYERTMENNKPFDDVAKGLLADIIQEVADFQNMPLSSRLQTRILEYVKMNAQIDDGIIDELKTEGLRIASDTEPGWVWKCYNDDNEQVTLWVTDAK